jgi:hypothetical protein
MPTVAGSTSRPGASGASTGSLASMELEMTSAGIVYYATDLDNGNFADIARAIGLHGVPG